MPREVFALIGGISLFLIVFALIVFVLESLSIAIWTRGKSMASHLIVIIICCVVGAVCGEIAWRLSDSRYAIAADIPSVNPKTEEKIAAPHPATQPKTLEKDVHKTPNIQQGSKGSNSPNIFGDHNVVTINPDHSEKLDEITNLLKAQGDSISRDKLLAKYSLGYSIFELTYKNDLYPYQSQPILDKYELDWSVVKITNNTATSIELRLPDIKRKDSGVGFTGVYTGGSKRVGNLGGAFAGEIAMWGEILAIGDKGIVFLVGFEPSPPFPKH